MKPFSLIKPSRQEIALAYPIYNPIAMLDKRYRKIAPVLNMRICSLVTVDTEPNITWHASGSIMTAGNIPIPFSKTPLKEFELFSKYVRNQVKSVGEGTIEVVQSDDVYHAFRKLTAEELTKIKVPEKKMMDKKTPPKELFMELQSNKEIETCAALEAGMTWMKKLSGREGMTYLYLYPEHIKTREEMFLFAMTFGKVLGEYENNLRQVPEEIKQMFAQNN